MSGIKFIKSEELLKEKVNHNINTFKSIIIQSGTVPNLLQFAKAKLNKEETIETHLHESMYEVFYVMSGELLVIENNKQTKVSTGDTFIVYPKQYHSLEILKDSEMIYFNLEEK